MIKADDLDGRAVVDLEIAKKIGYVDEIYLDTDGGRIAAYRVSEGSGLTGGSKILVPAEAVQTIGPEAIMVRPVGEGHLEHDALDRLPRLSHIKGRKVVSETGKLLGAIDDVMLADDAGRIHAYTLKSASWTDSLLGNDDDHPDYVRGDANLRLGEDLMVVPEDALVRGTGDHQHDDASSSSIDALSTTERSAARRHMTPAEPAGVEYAERIHTTEPVRHTEPVGHVERTEHWDDVRGQYQSRWERRTAGRGGLWEEHEPGYRYGWETANRPTYRGQTWTTAEPELRRDWESRHHDRPWDRVVDAIRDAWEGVTDHDKTDVAGYRSTHDHDESPGAIERLQARPIPADETTVAESRPVTARPAAYPHESVTDPDHPATRRVADEGPDSRRSLL